MARRDEVWQERLGTWVELIWAEGRDVLINGLNHYLNFGFTNGSSGYGIRDNDGVMEAKNSGGGWGAIATGSGGTTGAVIGLTDSGDHKNYTLAKAATSTQFVLLMNNGLYPTDDANFPFAVASTTLTFTSTLPTDLAGTVMKLICV